MSNLIIKMLNAFTFEGILALWFLPALFIAEIFFYFWFYLFRKHIFLSIFIIFLIIISTSLFAKLNFREYNGFMFYILSFVNIFSRALIGFLFLAFGFFVMKFAKKIKVRKRILAILGLCFITTNLLFYRYNIVDLHYSIIGNPIFYYINAICGSLSLLIFSFFVGEHLKLISFYGKNSIVLFSTHLNFNLITLTSIITGTILPIENIYITFIINFIILMVIETILVFVINKYFKFIISYSDFKKIVSQECVI